MLELLVFLSYLVMSALLAGVRYRDAMRSMEAGKVDPADDHTAAIVGFLLVAWPLITPAVWLTRAVRPGAVLIGRAFLNHAKKEIDNAKP